MADQHAVVTEGLTTAGFAVLVYVNWHCAGVAAAVAWKVTTLAAAAEVNMAESARIAARIPAASAVG